MKTILTLFFALTLSISYSQEKAVVKIITGQTYILDIIERTDNGIQTVDENGKERFIRSSSIESISVPCKLKVNEVDDMTGDFKKLTNRQSLALKLFVGNVFVKVGKVNDLAYLELELMFNEIYSISAGNKVILKTQDGDLVNLENMVYTLPEHELSHWISFIKLPLSSEAIQTLSKPLEKIRIYGDKEYYEFNIKGKDSQAISRLLMCIN